MRRLHSPKLRATAPVIADGSRPPLRLLRSLAVRGFACAILPRSLTAWDGPAIEVRSLRPAVRLPVALVWRRARI